jgi:hypothetical protein
LLLLSFYNRVIASLPQLNLLIDLRSSDGILTDSIEIHRCISSEWQLMYTPDGERGVKSRSFLPKKGVTLFRREYL